MQICCTLPRLCIHSVGRACLATFPRRGAALCPALKGGSSRSTRLRSGRPMETAHAILEKKSLLEEELRRVERQIYELEGEYLQETVKDGNILRGWDSYLGKQASSGAIRRINRFREADRMFSGSSVTSGQASTVTTSQAVASSAGGTSSGGAKVKKAPSGARKRGRDDADA